MERVKVKFALALILAIFFFFSSETLSFASQSFQNEYLQIWDSRILDGIIDLFYKDSNGQWQQYNNIVPIAKVNNVWANAELDQAIIETTLLSNQNGIQEVKYQFSPLSNGSHFYLLMTLESGKREVKFQAVLNSDSALVQALSLGNYYGLAHVVRFLEVNSQTYDAFIYPRPAGGIGQLGDFYSLPAPTNKLIKFRGAGSPIIQTQSIDAPLSSNDVLMMEIRFTPYLASQIAPGVNWIETVHITREPFTTEKSIWRFGIQKAPEDINQDGKVDILDLARIVNARTQSSINPYSGPEDVTGNGQLDVNDLNSFLQNYTHL